MATSLPVVEENNFVTKKTIGQVQELILLK
jgi:hypothetical protein